MGVWGVSWAMIFPSVQKSMCSQRKCRNWKVFWSFSLSKSSIFRAENAKIRHSFGKMDHFVIKTGHLVRKIGHNVRKIGHFRYKNVYFEPKISIFMNFLGKTFGINNSIANLFLIWWNYIWIIPYPCLQCSKSIYQRKFRKSRFQFEISICLSNV